MTEYQPTAVEIFAGGGGLSVGLKAAGFRPVAAIEMEPNAAATFKANHPDVPVFQQDVRQVNGGALLQLVGGKVDVLAACPPCQGFSSLTSKWRKVDPRNELVSEVSRLARDLLPRAVMVENVPGLAVKGQFLFEQLLRELSELGYICTWDVLQVADYGVPQRRRRLVLLAGRGFKLEMPPATHSRDPNTGRERWKTLRDTISNMGEPLTLTQAKARGGPQAVDWHVVRVISEATRERLRRAQPGKTWTSFPEDIRPKCHRGNYRGFMNVYGRMTWDEPSVTITAGCTTLSKGRFGHPDQERTISIREAALLQTFPPDYRFETTSFDRACDIVGNALPCDFAKAIATQVMKCLREPKAR